MNKKQRKQQKRQIRQAAAMVWLHKITIAIESSAPYTLWNVLESFQQGSIAPAELRADLHYAEISEAPTMQALHIVGKAMLKGKGLSKRDGKDVFCYAVYDYMRWVCGDTHYYSTDSWNAAISFWKDCLRDEREAVRK